MQLYLLRFPQFLGIEPHAFTLQSFRPPTTNHHSKQTTAAFSPAQTANGTIRWRRDPNDFNKLQSNARIIRWSDGSLTLQVASSPMEQHELAATALAPAQRHPTKPTPISDPHMPAPPYRLKDDAQTYVTSTHPGPGLTQLTNHVTASLTVRTGGAAQDDDAAVLALQAAMAQHKGGGTAAATGTAGGGGANVGPAVLTTLEDPELAKRTAEKAERERNKLERRRLLQIERDRERSGRVLGRAGIRSGGAVLAGLEEEALGKARGPKRPAGARRPRKRRDSYTDEDEEGDWSRRGRTREDEYDEEDDFVAPSDEDPEVVEDEEEEEEEEEEGKGAQGAEGADEGAKKPIDATAATAEPGPQDAGPGQAPLRGRRRKILDDDDDEE